MVMLSVIIPLAPSEAAWKKLFTDLAKLPDETEIILVSSQKENAQKGTIFLPNKKIYWLTSKPGRAAQMNAGAMAARGKYLWFLHADSRFAGDTLSALFQLIQNSANQLLYFDLAFLDDALPFMFLNAWGAYFRSRLLKVPFGDQGFCISKVCFQKLNGFPENLPYGEDHVFVWKARQHGVEVKPICATLYTSARKYKKHGWLKTTVMHQYLWIKQAWPEWKKLRRGQ